MLFVLFWDSKWGPIYPPWSDWPPLTVNSAKKKMSRIFSQNIIYWPLSSWIRTACPAGLHACPAGQEPMISLNANITSRSWFSWSPHRRLPSVPMIHIAALLGCREGKLINTVWKLIPLHRDWSCNPASGMPQSPYNHHMRFEDELNTCRNWNINPVFSTFYLSV